MTKLLSIIFLFVTLQTVAQTYISQNDVMDINLIYSNYLENNKSVSKEFKSLYAINKINGIDYLSVLMKVNSNFQKSNVEDYNAIIGSKVQSIISVKYPLENLEHLLETQNILTLQVAGKIKPTLNKVLWDIRADSVHQGIDLPQAYTGKDVIIGITDWGFDYSHPNFYDTLLQNTRILAAWDQFKTAGPAPIGYTYGTEYNTPLDLINAGSDTSNIYSYHYHGTHVAGICGGSSAGTSFRGVGFESQFLFTTFLVDEGSVMDAWQWMYDKSVAEGKPLVVNMSWGLYQMGASDGTSLLSQALDNFSNLGVLFVTSAGNNGDNDFHIKKTFNADEMLTQVTFSSTLYSPYFWGQSIHAWGEGANEFSAGIKLLDNSNQVVAESQYYSTLTTTTYVDSFIVYNGINDTVFFNLSMDHVYPTNGKPQMRLRIKKPNGIKVVLKSMANSGTVHFWNVAELSTDVGNWGNDFVAINANYTAGDVNYGIGAPACSNTAITVAAYSSQTNTNGGPFIGGTLASFSSTGPLMNEVLKPDISAPGVTVGSSVSSYTDASFNQVTSVNFNGRDYPFTRISGTSMSSPVVAGVASLILEANPYLSPWQVKYIIKETARLDIKTGNIGPDGDYSWGYGKINAHKAIKLALQTVGINQKITKSLDWQIYPNPTSSVLNIKGLTGENRNIQVINLSGKIVLTTSATSSINLNDIPNGTYILRILNEDKVEQKKFIILR